MALYTLPPDALAKVLQNLSVEDVHNLQSCSKQLHAACQDERVWFALCQATWSGCTDVRRWLPAERGSPAGRGGPVASYLRPPLTYQDLFHLLRCVEGLRGLWRVIGEGPEGGLVSFDWVEDGLEGVQVAYHALHEAPDRSPAHRFCPRRGLSTAVEWGAGSGVTLREYGAAGSTRGSMRRSPSGDLAAEVGLGTSPQAGAVLGTSPQGSFEHAWLEFMSSSVAKPSRQRRRSGRDGWAGAAAAGPVLTHLRRVERPQPSRKHPLAGMWAGNYGPGGVQVLNIRYDFSGRAARIIAEKVTGDGGVPAGQRTWTAAAAALPLPWPAEDQGMVDAWQEAAEQANAEAEEALGGLGVLLFEDGDGSSGDEGGDDGAWGMDGVAGASGGTRAATVRRERRRVVSIHAGSGHVAGAGQAPSKCVDGRLWVHADGTLSFYWLEGLMRLVAMRRIDCDLLPP